MKALLASIPNRLKAIYLVWVMIHFTLFLLGLGEPLYYKVKDFYPFGLVTLLIRVIMTIQNYLFTSLLPIVIYIAVSLWKKK